MVNHTKSLPFGAPATIIAVYNNSDAGAPRRIQPDEPGGTT